MVPGSKTAIQRWLLLILMGLSLAVLLQSQERDIRLIAALALIVFGQIREVLLLDEAAGHFKTNASK